MARKYDISEEISGVKRKKVSVSSLPQASVSSPTLPFPPAAEVLPSNGSPTPLHYPFCFKISRFSKLYYLCQLDANYKKMEEPILSEEIREVEYSAKIDKNPFTQISTLDIFSDGKQCVIIALEDNANSYALLSHSLRSLMFSFSTFLKGDICRVRFQVYYHNGFVQKGDKLSFLFEDDSIQDFYIEDEYGNINLYKSDFDLLMTKQIKLARYEDEACNNVCQFKFLADESKKLVDSIAFFLRAIEKAWGWKPEIQPEPEPLQIDNTSSFEEVADFCYVYLMLDYNTGLYKIGMSNNPEIRERTLQSEKPTIVKLGEKRLPSREIAAAMEKMLHSLFSDKRVRGEWFKLSPFDIWKIQEILK